MRSPALVQIIALMAASHFADVLSAAELDVTPRVLDQRFQVTLIAEDPEIVTPIGAVVDARGRLFVVESHTHDATKNYSGPKSDRIKIFSDTNRDGVPKTHHVFTDGLQQALNLAFAPDGTLYVVAAKEIFALHDRDGDGTSEARTSVMKLDTRQSNPHGQLLALTISHDGWLYTSRGNIGGQAYSFIGSDGHKISGQGEGGEIVRCRIDGSQLERVATGFWNPFDLRFDARDRLLCVDNDPDSRGPNRLLHIVPGGDYGYRALYGPSGLHPYNAWEGDLPGTLPMIAGVGEAPSAVLDLSLTGFPADYGDAILVTVWGEHNLTLYRPRPEGVSLRATAEKFIEGGKFFRPVALAPSPDGSVYITDWVLKDYPNHLRGRVWRLALKPDEKGRTPRPQLAKPTPDPTVASFEKIAAANAPAQFEELSHALRSNDPFIQTAAIQALARPVFRDAVLTALNSNEAALRLGALLVLRRADYPDPVPLLRKLLDDADLTVRQMALIWAGEKLLHRLLPDLDRAVASGEISPRLFETWLATVQILQSAADEPTAKQARASVFMRDIDSFLIERVIHDASRAPKLRALALPRLKDPDKLANRELLMRLARDGSDPTLRVESIRTLAATTSADTAKLLTALALDTKEVARLRAEALVALASHPAADALAVQPLLDDTAPGVALQTARTLRVAASKPSVRDALERKLTTVTKQEADARLREQLELSLGRTVPSARPATLEDWQRQLTTDGDVESGERVFFSSSAGCVQCHRIRHRGGTIGPDLSAVARTANRAQLIQSIVRPSDDIAPQFQGWMVETKDGESITGLQGHLRGGGAVSIITVDGRTRNIPGAQVESFQAMKVSLMPDGLADTLTIGDFRDLIAFLESLK